MSADRKSGFRILSIDPGTRVVGTAVLEFGRGLQPIVLHHGSVVMSRNATRPERLGEIHAAVAKLVDRFHPHGLVVEDIFYGKNIKSAFRIGEARGVVLLAAAQAGIEVIEYPPATVKQAVCGNGRASKVQIQRMVCRLLELDEAPDTFDAADAIAIGFCHLSRLRGGFPRPPNKTRKSTDRSLQRLADRVEGELQSGQGSGKRTGAGRVRRGKASK